MAKKSNNELEIRFLNPSTAVRKRPGMYIGSTANANVLIREIIDNSCDEVSAGYGNAILISNNFNDGWNFVADQGRGIPITYSKDKPDVTQAYLSISELHSGSKFEGSDVMRSGLNGCGSACVNFLSAAYILMSKITEDNFDKSIPEVKEVWESSIKSKKDLFYIVVCEEGQKVFEGAGKLKDLEKTIFKACGKDYIHIPSGLSTIVLFKADPKIFDNPVAEIPWKNLEYYMLIQEKFYKRKVEIVVDGESMRNSFKPYQFEVCKTIIPANTEANKEVGFYMTFEVSQDLSKGQEDGSCNALDTPTGFHMNLAKSLYKAALKTTYKPQHDLLLNGLKFKVIVLANEVNYSSQTKENLKAITKVTQKDFLEVAKEFEKVFKKNSDYWDDVMDRLDQLAESMKKISASGRIQKMLNQGQSGSGFYKSKLDMTTGFSDATCGPTERMNAELFICEGLSPASSLKSGRKDTRYQGILPLRGKILNVSSSSVDDVLDNKVLSTMFKAIGLGMDDQNVTVGCKTREEAWEKIKANSRYGKICIATDADPDGLAIQNGLTYAISKFARFLIDFGLVYIAESPEFIQGGKYYYPSDPKQPGTILPVGMDPNKPYRHIKGLGSLNQGDVYNAFYNPATRRLIQLTPEGMDYSMGLVEDINNRKQLLRDKGILTNPYNFTDI